MLTEYVRSALARTITKLYQSPDGNMYVLTLDQDVEKFMADSVQQTDQGNFLTIDPGVAQQIVNNLMKKIDKFAAKNYQPIILCSAQIRSHFKKLMTRFIPELVVLSYNEILSDIRIQTLGTVGLTDAN
jgi:flagellar biosynthesis protein FlhA